MTAKYACGLLKRHPPCGQAQTWYVLSPNPTPVSPGFEVILSRVPMRACFALAHSKQKRTVFAELATALGTFVCGPDKLSDRLCEVCDTTLN